MFEIRMLYIGFELNDACFCTIALFINHLKGAAIQRGSMNASHQAVPGSNISSLKKKVVAYEN